MKCSLGNNMGIGCNVGVEGAHPFHEGASHCGNCGVTWRCYPKFI